MFESEYTKESIERLNEFMGECVECEECGCLIMESIAKKVTTSMFPEYYCKVHKPPYDRVEYPDWSTGIVSTRYYKDNVLVDEDGKVIKKK